MAWALVTCSAFGEADQIFGSGTSHFILPVAAAQRDVNVLADCHLFALADYLPVRSEPDHHGRLAAAATDGAHLAQLIRYGKQGARTGKQVALEVGTQAVAHDRNVQPVGDACELPDLLFLQELRLVHKDAMDGGVLMSLGDAGIKVVALSEYLGLGFQADARGDQPVISAAVVASDEEQSVHPALTII